MQTSGTDFDLYARAAHRFVQWVWTAVCAAFVVLAVVASFLLTSCTSTRTVAQDTVKHSTHVCTGKARTSEPTPSRIR